MPFIFWASVSHCNSASSNALQQAEIRSSGFWVTNLLNRYDFKAGYNH